MQVDKTADHAESLSRRQPITIDYWVTRH